MDAAGTFCFFPSGGGWSSVLSEKLQAYTDLHRIGHAGMMGCDFDKLDREPVNCS